MERLRHMPLVALAVCLLVSGCRSMEDSKFWPFGKTSDKVPGITPPPERMKAIRAMGKEAGSKPPAAQEPTAERLGVMYAEEKDPLIRSEVIHAAGMLSCPRAIEVLRNGLKDSDADVRVVACKSLGNRGGKDSSTALQESLASDTDPDVRLAAARALGQTGDPEAVRALGSVLDDHDPAMQYRAVTSLRQVAPQDQGSDVERWRSYVRGEPPPPSKPFSLSERLKNMF